MQLWELLVDKWYLPVLIILTAFLLCVISAWHESKREKMIQDMKDEMISMKHESELEIQRIRNERELDELRREIDSLKKEMESGKKG